MRKVDYCVLHCTAGPRNQSVESIKAHWKRLGWKTVGYHRLISPDGTVHNLADYSDITNGVKGFNAVSIHISYIGGIDSNGRAVDNRTDAQKAAQKVLIEEAAKLFPGIVILGHRDFSPDKNRDGAIQPGEWMKTCPSFSVKDWLKEIGFKSANKEYCRTLGALNMRSGFGTQFSIVTTLMPGVPVEKISEKNGWAYCQYGRFVGWIRSDLLIKV